MNQYEKSILSVFRTYTDAYLEYVNNWATIEAFREFYSLSSDELSILLRAVSELRVNGGKWSELDYYYNAAWNVEYSEKSAIY